MFTILILGFRCSIYKNNPTARIYFDDLFIDEISIESSDNSEATPKLYFYQLRPRSDISKSSIKLKIDNDDSNYNNSFMTKSTLLKIHSLYMVPAKDCETAYKLFKNRSIKPFNMISHTWWESKLGDFRQDIEHYNIGGSGVFTCNVIKDFNYFRSIPNKY